MTSKDIAVIGMSCAFSNSRNPDEFWRHLREGKELIRVYDDRSLREMGMDESVLADPRYIKIGSVIDRKNFFDASFFGYTREEAWLMDPQTRMFHEHAWKAIEDAGYDPYQYGGRIGVFAGASENLNWSAHAMMTEKDSDIDPFFKNQLSGRNYISTLVSYKLNCKGPSYFIDTACSTSLVTIHVACRNLLMRECDMAIAGAVRIDTTTMVGYRAEEGMIASLDGHCRPFDAAASGTTTGEGIGIVVLKRLEEAMKDKDHIYAVIKSSAVNNDGSRKVGYTAPSVAGQAECIMLAHKVAAISPMSVSYVETHGTATALGDPIEIEALNRAFGNDRNKYCAIGSVKSNLGHLDTAAGMAGFIKTVLALQHKEIPPSLFFENPNPEIDFDNGPFYVNTSLQKWTAAPGHPLRAGVSSFGIGGTNAHLVLEEAPLSPPSPATSLFHLLLCSARTEKALSEQVEEIKRSLLDGRNDLVQIAYTLQNRRRHFKYRQYAVADGPGTAISALASGTREDMPKDAPGIVFQFSGQGSQYKGMGKELYEQQPLFRRLMDEGLATLKKITGDRHDYYRILYGTEEHPGEDIHNTLYTQPLLFVFEFALAGLLIDIGIRPDYVIGHSIGELVAACVSGVISFDDGLSMVCKRAELISGLPEGAMLSIGRPASEVTALLGPEAWIAAINAPDLCVASGSHRRMQELAATLHERDIPFSWLKTSHAFHSGMMEPVAANFIKAISDYRFDIPKIPLVSNVTGRIMRDEIPGPAYWSDHIRKPVLFSEGIGALLKEGKWIFIEIGPGNVLTALCRRIDRTGSLSLNMIRRPMEEVSDRRLFLERLGELWMKGMTINWKTLFGSEGATTVSLPAYPFEEQFFPAQVDPSSPVKDNILEHRDSNHKARNMEDWFYWPVWKRSPIDEEEDASFSDSCFLLFSDQYYPPTDLKEWLISKGHRVIEVIKGDRYERIGPSVFRINAASKDDYILLYKDMYSDDLSFDQLLYFSTAVPAGTGESISAGSVYNAFFELLHLLNGLKLQDIAGKKKFFFITRNGSALPGRAGEAQVHLSASLGLFKVFSQETPDFFCCHLDIEPEAIGLLADVYREFRFNSSLFSVAIRNDGRWTEAYERATLGKRKYAAIRQKGTYLLTGGTGRVGLLLAAFLLSNYQANVILIGKTPPRPGAKAAALEELKNLPGQIACYDADIADYDRLRKIIATAEEKMGKVNGIVHAAGNVDPDNFRPVGLISTTIVNNHFDPKIKGLLNLYELSKGREMDFVWIVSSLSSVLGGWTFGAYAASNLFMDHFISYKYRELKTWTVVDMDGLAFGQESPEQQGITAEEFIRIFERSHQGVEGGRLIVSPSDLHHRSVVPDRTPVRSTMPDGSASAPASTENKMIAMLQDLLGIEDVGPEDDFFEMGGDSLRAMTLSKRIYREFNVNIPIEKFFTHNNPRLLAGEIDLAMELRSLTGTGNGSGQHRTITI
jgi:acyl transferase domain-containing protein/acyl carrier protein